MPSLRHLAFGVLLAMAAPLPAQQGEPIRPGAQPREFRSTYDQTMQPYNLYVPKAHDTETSVPLVVVLHGKGATWKSWFDATTVKEWGEAEGYAIAAPHGRGDWFYLGPGERDVLDTIADVRKRLRIDPDRIYLLGHSMGGWGTWHTGIAHQDLFAAIVPMACWAPEEMLPGARNLAPFLIHGAKDDVVRVDHSRNAVNSLLGMEVMHNYLEWPEAGHESQMISDSFPAIGDWLRGRRRNPAPEHFALAALTPERGRAYWVQMRRLEAAGVVALLDVRRETDGELRFSSSNLLEFAIDPNALPSPPAPGTPMRLRIDDIPTSITMPLPGEVFTFDRDIKGWTPAKISRQEFNNPPELPFATLDAPVKDPARAVAQIISRQQRGDVVLLPKDLVSPEVPAGVFNWTKLMDLWLRPEDGLCAAMLTRAQYDDLVARRDWYPAYWGELTVFHAKPLKELNFPVRVVVPELLAQRMPLPMERIDARLRTTLAEEFRRTRRFPDPPAHGGTP